MRILVTGAKGQLGQDVVKRLATEHEVSGFGREQMDLAVPSTIGRTLATEEPDLIIHCGAYTKVDQAEMERELCYRINTEATRSIAMHASESGARLIFVSTDYVFDGTKPEPYEVDDQPRPINFYGQTKLEGELAIKELMRSYQIVRASWIFGAGGINFVRTVINLGREREILKVVSDQVGSPTYTVDLAGLIEEMVRSDNYGTFHATNEGYCSWYQFAVEILSRTGLKAKVVAINSEDYHSKALRPINSRLGKRSLDEAGFHRLPTWQNALDRYLLETKEV